MKTFYIRYDLHLLDENKDYEPVPITLDFWCKFSRLGKGPIEYALNTVLLDFILDKNAFAYKQELIFDNLCQYLHPDDPKEKQIISLVTSIVPINICTVEISKNLRDPLGLYLYVKVNAKEELPAEILEDLIEYVDGQMSDGWGEGFCQNSIQGYGLEIDWKSSVKVDRIGQ